MSKIANDSLTRSGTGCIAVHMATVGVKWLYDYSQSWSSIRSTVFSAADTLLEAAVALVLA